MNQRQLFSERVLWLVDFNIDSASASSSQTRLLNFFSDCNFQMAETNYTTDGRTVIDHIYSNFDLTAGLYEMYFS